MLPVLERIADRTACSEPLQACGLDFNLLYWHQLWQWRGALCFEASRSYPVGICSKLCEEYGHEEAGFILGKCDVVRVVDCRPNGRNRVPANGRRGRAGRSGRVLQRLVVRRLRLRGSRGKQCDGQPS